MLTSLRIAYLRPDGLLVANIQFSRGWRWINMQRRLEFCINIQWGDGWCVRRMSHCSVEYDHSVGFMWLIEGNSVWERWCCGFGRVGDRVMDLGIHDMGKCEWRLWEQKKRNNTVSLRFHYHVVLCLTDMSAPVVIQGRVRDSSWISCRFHRGRDRCVLAVCP